MPRQLYHQYHVVGMKKMKPKTDNFFLGGGFSSSQWNCTKRIDDVDVMESLYEIEPILHDFDLFTSHCKSEKSHQRSRCGVSA
ncbi:MAG: hypothetical protein COA77_06455 [Thaumarchaeota archaeon]|nr:MAG: hypothetical protein COA77_06455 [Nitrososphaerota archaeon]